MVVAEEQPRSVAQGEIFIHSIRGCRRPGGVLGGLAVEGIFSPASSVDFTETWDVLVLPANSCGPVAARSSHLTLPCWEAVGWMKTPWSSCHSFSAKSCLLDHSNLQNHPVTSPAYTADVYHLTASGPVVSSEGSRKQISPSLNNKSTIYSPLQLTAIHWKGRLL